MHVDDASLLLPLDQMLVGEGDLPVNIYVSSSSWQPKPAEIIINELPANKALYLREELRQHALRSMVQASVQDRLDSGQRHKLHRQFSRSRERHDRCCSDHDTAGILLEDA